MSFNTPGDIVTFALKAAGVLGVGQTPLAEDTNDAFTAMNGMLAGWQRQRWLVWHLVDVSKVSTGAQSYTVGPGGDFNVMRPDRLEAAFFRQFINSTPNQVDYPLQILEAREDYNNIALKQLNSFPYVIFYDSAFPMGTVYPWPIPQANTYEIHLTLKEQISQFLTLTQQINLPPEYEEALWTNLCLRLCPIYQVQPNPSVVALAKSSLAVVRGANAQVPRLNMPQRLWRGGLYDIYSDQSY